MTDSKIVKVKLWANGKLVGAWAEGPMAATWGDGHFSPGANDTVLRLTPKITERSP